MSSSALIQVHNLSRRFSQEMVVDDVNFELNSGEILGLLGHNGAGKSTTLNMITGTLAPTTGSIQIAGFDLQKQAKKAKQHLGYLPATAPIYDSMKVNEYLTFCAKLHLIPRDQIKAACQNTLEMCNLTQVSQQRLGHLSTGFKQRVGIAQAIIHQPDVIILDEPTNGLDPEQMADMRALLKSLSDNHSILFSSHLLSEVSSICDRVLMLNKGRQVLNQSLSSLQDTMQNVTLSIEFEAPPDCELIEQIKGIQSVETVTSQLYHVTTTDHKQTAQAIIKLSQQNHWGLFQISEATPILEQVFLKQMESPIEVSQ